MTGRRQIALGATLGLLWAAACPIAEARTRGDAVAHRPAHGRHQAARTASAKHRHAAAAAHPGHVQQGDASIYAENLKGRRMADGTPFNPASDTAASKTLPLGTTAQVTNLKNGRTATVRVGDRGPYKAGRIIDVSPGTAGALGMKTDGVAPVAVVPLALPPAAKAE